MEKRKRRRVRSDVVEQIGVAFLAVAAGKTFGLSAFLAVVGAWLVLAANMSGEGS